VERVGGPRSYEAASDEGVDLSVERNAPVEEFPSDTTPGHLAPLDEPPRESTPVSADDMTRPKPAALGDVVEHHPPVEIARAPGKVVEVNKSAFETWLRQLSGKE
jgi:hypothetical protein